MLYILQGAIKGYDLPLISKVEIPVFDPGYALIHLPAEST